MPAPRRFEPNVISLAIQVFLCVHQRISVAAPLVCPAIGRRGLAVLGVEIERVRRQGLVVSAVVHVEVERAHFSWSFVPNRDAGVFLKGHGEKTIQSFIRAHRKRNCLIQKVVAQAKTEEIANGSFDAGRGLTVPVHAQNELLQVIGVVTSDGEPDMTDKARARFVQYGKRIARCDSAKVSIGRSEEHTSELQSQSNLVCRLLLEKKKKITAHQDVVDLREHLRYYILNPETHSST